MNDFINSNAYYAVVVSLLFASALVLYLFIQDI